MLRRDARPVSYSPAYAAAYPVSGFLDGASSDLGTLMTSGDATQLTSGDGTELEWSGAFVGNGISLIANYTAAPNFVFPGTSGGRSDVQHQGRTEHQTGASAVTEIQMGMCRFWIPGTGPTVGAGSGVIISNALETIGSPNVNHGFTYSGNATASLNDGDALVLSDTIPGLTIPANTLFWIRQDNVMPAAADNFSTTIMNALNSQFFTSPATTSQVGGIGNLTTPTGGLSSVGRLSPLVLVGKFATPQPSVIFTGDSIANGINDSPQHEGFIARGLATVNGNPMPYQRQTEDGWKYSHAANSLDFLSPAWKYCTDILIELGNNDCATDSVSTILTNARLVWAKARTITGPYGRTPRIWQMTLLPRTTSTDSFKTPGNQTIASGYGPGEARFLFNAALAAEVAAGRIDGIVDICPNIEDQSNLGKWVTDGSTANFYTVDGIHPNSTANQTPMAPIITTWASALTV